MRVKRKGSEAIIFCKLRKPTDPSNILMIGSWYSRIEYDVSLSQWILRNPVQNMTARTWASQKSLALGKYNWTISGGDFKCAGGKDYTLEMKLSGCKRDQFTNLNPLI